jgi:predicted nucleotidyltransferase
MGALEDRTVKKYKKYWDERASHDKIAREKLRRQALKVSKRLGEILISEFHAEKVVLFGSILDRDRFREGSDIDMAVAGMPAELYFAALGRLIMESPFDIDLKPIEDASVLLKQRILSGKVLYEKRNHS